MFTLENGLGESKGLHKVIQLRNSSRSDSRAASFPAPWSWGSVLREHRSSVLGRAKEANAVMPASLRSTKSRGSLPAWRRCCGHTSVRLLQRRAHPASSVLRWVASPPPTSFSTLRSPDDPADSRAQALSASRYRGRLQAGSR